ncbi:cation-translocating P-type ATPase [Paraflavitalea pollutisoli]|uniref:cation-translocating P-type ATPase n=1 Tax=Paraflavitalea pollutisoli TaxID=3034143 RepID=UPI0023EDC776|nr:cation-translocating P-type ATPase [Paraflavitalea sp. H1-2-19X]
MDNSIDRQGLTADQVIANRKRYGANLTKADERSVLWSALWGMVKEPMFLLLVVTAILYFVLHQVQDAFIMLGALLLVSGISLYQDFRSSNAIKALNKLAAPRARVIRAGTTTTIPSEEIVVGDLVLLEEGIIIQADGTLLSSHDLTVNESVLTGESYALVKAPGADDQVLKGTLVTSGGGIMQVQAVGQSTRFGKIGESLVQVAVEKTPLQRQIHQFVRNMVLVGIVAFVVVVGVNLYLSGQFNTAFLQGLTLAMSILPEEIPVAFSTFQALGAYRLLRKRVIVKQPQYVETLGAATVICVDKTGTLTQNKMRIVCLYEAATGNVFTPGAPGECPAELLSYAMWSSETTPFDPMEKSIHALYEQIMPVDERPFFTQVHEYPLGGVPPMMTHIFRNSGGQTIIAVKGAPEAVLRNSRLHDTDRSRYLTRAEQYAQQGYRVLSVGKAESSYLNWPDNQEDFTFTFLGLLVFEDPIKPGIAQTIDSFRKAGVQVKMITGDYPATALTIARQAGLDGHAQWLTGEAVMKMNPRELELAVAKTTLFVRMYPEAKLKVINALKAAGEIVAMTGDGVNDAPALKAAHIGVAMGVRGSEVAKSAASLILANDDLQGMTDAIRLGRKIYDNLQKAIRYIISIHIPIILIVLLPLLLGWSFTGIFSPVHVIFLELIMGPTCSIIYEHEPVEAGTMSRPPRKISYSFLSFRQLLVSMLQGLAITAGCLGIGYYHLYTGHDESMVRTMIFVTLLFSNIFLTQLNRSFYYSVFTTIRYKNILVPLVTVITLAFIGSLLWVPSVRSLFSLSHLPANQLLACLGVAALSTGWLEIVKWKIRRSIHTSPPQSEHADRY